MDSPGSMKRSRLLQRHLLPFLLLFLLLTLSQCRGDALPGTCAVAGECESGGDAEAAAMAGKDRVKIDEESAQDAKSRVDPYALLKDGHAKLKAKNFEEAITAYNQLDAVLSSIYGTMLHGRGVAHSMLQQHLQAAADFKQAVAKQPSKPEYWMELGQEYTILNDYENAHNAFTKAVELDPHNDKARRFRGMSAFEIEHYAAALGDLIPALTQDPSNPELLTQVAASLLRLNHYRESQPYWEEGVQAHPDDGNLWLQKGITHRILGEGQKAVDSLLMGLTVEENIEIYHNLAATRRYQGDHWGAIEWCDKGLAFRPEDSELLYVRASMHHALGDHATALAGYDHLMAMGAGRQMTFNQALAFYQREVLLYTVARLDLPFSAFQMDEDMDVDFKVAWLNRRVPPSLPKYHNLSVPDHQLEGATWQLLPQLSEGALAVIAAADEIGWRAHYETDGVMPNKQQLRMAGLAALDVMQRVRGTWEAIADEQRLPSIVDDDEDGEGRRRGREERTRATTRRGRMG
ncbi:hypothetical protein CLOM_g17282 [Closterium sp. NIES-68]|nr:hypothetical protein CLOM_g17282 [Closterium sp. NIES-68]